MEINISKRTAMDLIRPIKKADGTTTSLLELLGLECVMYSGWSTGGYDAKTGETIYDGISDDDYECFEDEDVKPRKDWQIWI